MTPCSWVFCNAAIPKRLFNVMQINRLFPRLLWENNISKADRTRKHCCQVRLMRCLAFSYGQWVAVLILNLAVEEEISLHWLYLKKCLPIYIDINKFFKSERLRIGTGFYFPMGPVVIFMLIGEKMAILGGLGVFWIFNQKACMFADYT